MTIRTVPDFNKYIDFIPSVGPMIYTAQETVPQTYDEEYTLVLKGFDVVIVPSDQGPDYYYVTLYEGTNNEVFSEDIPIPETQPGDTSEDTIENVAQAAIDIFEAERDTLGEGAGAEMTAKKKVAWLGNCTEHEEWFMSLKGTEYEEIAYGLLKDYLSIDVESTAQDDVLHELYDREAELEYELKMLDLERMKAMPVGTQVIIIKAKKAFLGEAEVMQEFLDKFCGDPLEGKVVQLLDELINVKQDIKKHQEGADDFWDRRQDVERQMEALTLEALQGNIIDKIPTSGIEAFPNMAGEIAELMEGVEMDAPLEPTMPNPFQASKRSQMTPPEEPDDIYAQEWKSVEDRIREMGEVHEGLDPAETLVDIPFKEGDKVKLTKKFETVAPLNGVKVTLSSGAVGYIQNEYDRNGECYMVAFEDGGCLKVPADYLKSA
jgi:hypothetical protein